jgi:hypothetical protein
MTSPSPPPNLEDSARSPARVFVPPTPDELGPRFPQLEVLRLLGQGGMGAVYLARQPELDRLVALKILPPEVARDAGFMERFSREARLLARLNHPNIVTIFDFGTADGLYYFTMEYVDGKNVRELLSDGAIAAPSALKIIAQVCDALQYAHDDGFVHRDIKPENILLDTKGRVKIADFGLARLIGLTPAYLTLTGSQQLMGTLYYMAPEQLRQAHSVDHRADLYSLGVVFYEMLTGELPVGRFGPPSQRAGVDSRLDAIVLKALAREPEHRHQDAVQIKREVESVAAGVSLAPAEPGVPVLARPDYPCVRFSIPDINWAGGKAQGEVYRTESTLILDFSVQDAWGVSAKHKEVRLPLAQILMMSCHTTPPGALARWLGLGGRTEIVLKAHDPEALAKLPTGLHGRGRLRIHRADGEAAQQLVDSIVRSPLPVPVRPVPTPIPPIPAPATPTAGPDRVRRQLLGPAIGMLLTAGLAFVSTIMLAGQLIVRVHDLLSWHAELLLIPGVALLSLIGTAVMMSGAVQMIVACNRYRLCVAAAILALVPVSPAWPLGVAFGIWALIVLGRPEVIAAFDDQHRGGNLANNGDSEPTSAVGGGVGAWFRSFAGYFLTTFAGPRSRRGVEGRLDQED